MRVLLVEDQPDAARLLAKGLREQTYAVDVANTATAAGFRAGTTDYDAIILDVMFLMATASKSAGNCGLQVLPFRSSC